MYTDNIFTNRLASPMLIASQTKPFDHPDWIYELKMDGFRCLAYVEPGKIDFRNKRNMQMNARFPELLTLHHNAEGRCILDGEIVVMIDGYPDFYRLQKRTLLTDPFKTELEAVRFPASYVVFDCIYCNGKALIWESQINRKEILETIITETPRIAVSRYIAGQGNALFQAADKQKLEGVVAKNRNSIYLMGKRTKDWVKFKRMADEEFVIAGYIKKENSYTLVLGKYQGDNLVYKGQVSSGVSKAAVANLRLTNDRPFEIGSKASVSWVIPDQVGVVEYMPNTLDTLRQPVFKGYRDDIYPKEVQM